MGKPSDKQVKAWLNKQERELAMYIETCGPAARNSKPYRRIDLELRIVRAIKEMISK